MSIGNPDDGMVSRPRGGPASTSHGRHEVIPSSPLQAGRPPFDIRIEDADGHLLVSFREENGRLVVEGDESRWDEGAKRFLYAMMQWSGQVGIRWRDEATRAAEPR